MADYNSNFTGNAVDVSVRKGELLPPLTGSNLITDTWGNTIENKVLIGRSDGTADFAKIDANNIAATPVTDGVLHVGTNGAVSWSDTVKNATYAQYTDASHTSKTIEQRLSSLGFKKASLSGYFTSGAGVIREGNFIIGTDYYSSISEPGSGGTYTHIGEGSTHPYTTFSLNGSLQYTSTYTIGYTSFKPYTTYSIKIGGALAGAVTPSGNLYRPFFEGTVTFSAEDGTIKLSNIVITGGLNQQIGGYQVTVFNTYSSGQEINFSISGYKLPIAFEAPAITT